MSTLAEIGLDAAHGQLAGHAQVVLQVHVAQVPGQEGAGQVGRVGVPVEQVEGRRLAALQVVADHVLPDQVVGAQRRKHRRQFAAGEQAALADGVLARLTTAASSMKQPIRPDRRNRAAWSARSARRHRSLAARLRHRQGRRDDGAADAEAQRIDLRRPCRSPGDHLEGGQRALLDVIVPAEMALSSAWRCARTPGTPYAPAPPRSGRRSSPAAGRGCSTC